MSSFLIVCKFSTYQALIRKIKFPTSPRNLQPTKQKKKCQRCSNGWKTWNGTFGWMKKKNTLMMIVRTGRIEIIHVLVRIKKKHRIGLLRKNQDGFASFFFRWWQSIPTFQWERYRRYKKLCCFFLLSLSLSQMMKT